MKVANVTDSMFKRIRALESEVSELRAQKFVPHDLAYAGLLYIELDEGGAWRLQLAKARRAAGLPVDMNGSAVEMPDLSFKADGCAAA